MGLDLIPVSRAAIVVPELVRVPVLDADADRLLEPDRIFDVEPIARVFSSPTPFLIA